jgi:hypothetical protein
MGAGAVSALAFDPWAALKNQDEPLAAPNPANPPNQELEPASPLDGLAGLGDVPCQNSVFQPALLPAAIARHAAELLAEAERNPAVRIIDLAKAREYFRGRAIAELGREGRI